MCSLPQISEAEYEVMKIIWNHAPINTNEITSYLLETTTWNPKTIHTLIKRLVDKGAITYEKQGRIFVYTPAIKKADYISQDSGSKAAEITSDILQRIIQPSTSGNSSSAFSSSVKRLSSP